MAANELHLAAPATWHQPPQHCQHHNRIFVPSYFTATTEIQYGINHIYYKYPFEEFLTCQKMNRFIMKSVSARCTPTAAVINRLCEKVAKRNQVQNSTGVKEAAPRPSRASCLPGQSTPRMPRADGVPAGSSKPLGHSRPLEKRARKLL